jgi:ABC-2 type transport system ATP-binding protein
MYGKYWDRDFEKKLLASFDLPLKTRLSALSRGQKMKAALLSSLAYRPQLVVLDEPFSGLDPLVRDEFLTGLLELTETEGWTVWISSHDIEEVERFADRVAILHDGKLDIQEDVDVLQSRFRQVDLWFDGEAALPAAGLSADWLNGQVAGRSIRFVDSYYGEDRSLAAYAAAFPAGRVQNVRVMTLREIFVTLARSYLVKPS